MASEFWIRIIAAATKAAWKEGRGREEERERGGGSGGRKERERGTGKGGETERGRGDEG